MPKTFKLELTFVLTEEQQQKLVDSARLLYAKETPAFEFEGDHLGREVSADEAITNAASALTYVVDQNAIFEELGIQAGEISCTDPEGENSHADENRPAERFTGAGAADSETIEDEMDEWDHGLYLCRWPNGEFSIVNADTKRDALVQLDEFAGAHSGWLIPFETFLADFRLTDAGEIELNEFGEDTIDFIRNHCYPELEAVLSSGAINSDPGAYSPGEEEQIRSAVQRERTRLRGKLPKDPDAKTELGKHLQTSMRVTGPVADHYVESTARSILKSKEGEGGKPN